MAIPPTVQTSVEELKQVFTQYAPDYLTKRKHGVDDTAQYQAQGREIKPHGLGKFIPANLPGDTYVEKERRKNLERAMEGNKNFSHRAFITANPPNDSKARHGGWEGTFASRHGGYPHMFESVCPEKSKAWLGKTENKTGNTMPMLVKFPSKSGPGFPGRGIGGDPAYESEFNFEKIERLNRQLKLGAGSGFRSDMRKYSRPWITTDVRSRSSDIMAVYKEVEQTASARPIVSKASLLASRPAHSAPFISSAAARRLPTETFGSFHYVGDAFVDNVSKHFDAMMDKQRHKTDSKRGVKRIVHPPFRACGGTNAKSTPSVMFRKC